MLPFWLGEYIVLKEWAFSDIPGGYTRSILSAMQQDAPILNLADHSFYYFEHGSRCCSLINDEDLDLDTFEVLKKGFSDRLESIINFSWFPSDTSMMEMTLRPRLTGIEDELVCICREAYRRHQRSKDTTSCFQEWEASAKDPAVQNLLKIVKKRRRNE
eukprot:GHVL01012381.1.p1 GENE.GHVL01012381.1~~GHVL01012381.1.p1  ORF type:complete len:159 (+),score=26.20 GHVL01012381.1:495-971(+)